MTDQELSEWCAEAMQWFQERGGEWSLAPETPRTVRRVVEALLRAEPRNSMQDIYLHIRTIAMADVLAQVAGQLGGS